MMTAVVGVIAAVLVTAFAYATRRRETLLGTDEGYLWYGTQRLLDGEQPIRDFRSYEPGRYWWTALVARALGRGLVPVRLASHLAVGVALVVLAAVLGAAGASPVGLLLLPAVVLGWRSAHHKLIDTASMLLVAAGGSALLLDTPGAEVGFGIAIGLAAVTGLNLGAYAIATAGIIVTVGLVTGTVVPSMLLSIGAGCLAGTTPLLAWFARHQGTLPALWHARVVVPRRRGTTNLPLPIPWPWRRRTSAQGATTPTTEWIVRIGFVAAPALAVVVLVASTVGVVDAAVSAPLAAVGLMTFHHALSRADLSHLQLPAMFVIGSVVVLPGLAGIVGSIAAVGLTVPIVLATHPRIRRRRSPAAFERRQLLDDMIWMPRGLARQLDAVRNALEPREALAAIPLGIPILAALDTRSAVHDTYCVYPAGPEADEDLRADLEAASPVLVLVDTRAVSGSIAGGFPDTHPETWEWLQRVGTRIDAAELPRTVSLWRVATR